MANDGLMSIATNPELSTIEKFLLGGLVGAQETQKQTYKREQELTDAAMKQATDRITKAKAKEKEISTKHKGLFSRIYAAAGSTPAEVAKTLVAQGPDAVDEFVKMTKKDYEQSRATNRLKGVGQFVTAKGETIKLGPEIYNTPESAPDVARLSASLISAPTGKLPRTVSQTTFGEAVGQFFGMPRDRGELRRIAQERAASLTGYGSDIPMDEVDARSLYYAAGGEPKVRQQTGMVNLVEPFALKPADVLPAQEVELEWELGLRETARDKPEDTGRRDEQGEKIYAPGKSPFDIAAAQKIAKLIDDHMSPPPGGYVDDKGVVVLQGSLQDEIVNDIRTLIGQGNKTAFVQKYMRLFSKIPMPPKERIALNNYFDNLAVRYASRLSLNERFQMEYGAARAGRTRQ